MEWIERLNMSINYIEEHLTDELDYDELARIACCSSYHFQRMFTYMAGIPLSEYIRKRKMSLAAVDLQGGATKIIDISLKYGYSSPTAFNRAFQMVHGIAPSAVKNEGTSVKSFPPLTFKITIKGVEEMNYRIETKEAFRIVGVSQPLSQDQEANFKVVPTMWQDALEKGTLNRLAPLMDAQPMGVLGVSTYGENDQWRYYIAVASNKESGDFEECTVPAATWAIFSGAGTNQDIQKLEERIWTEWLPTSGYEYVYIADVEVYINADPNNAQYEVWIPVVKKQG